MMQADVEGTPGRLRFPVGLAFRLPSHAARAAAVAKGCRVGMREGRKKICPAGCADQFLRQAERKVATEHGVWCRGDECAQCGKGILAVDGATRKLGGRAATQNSN